jgi:hypothetical protein
MADDHTQCCSQPRRSDVEHVAEITTKCIVKLREYIQNMVVIIQLENCYTIYLRSRRCYSLYL